MGKFRNRLEGPKRLLARDEISTDLRRELWNSIFPHIDFAMTVGPHLGIGSSGLNFPQFGYVPSREIRAAATLRERLWTSAMCRSLSQLSTATSTETVDRWFTTAPWIALYDTIDLMVSLEPDNLLAMTGLDGRLNLVLQSEGSPWRFIDRELVPISAPEEIAAVAEAKGTAPELVQIHLQRAIDALASRDAPNVHGAITESIQAVESMAKHVLGAQAGTLGGLRQTLVNRGTHPAFASAVGGLYGYTSDEGGLRHAFKPGQDPNKHMAEGRFFVVTASAFVNYLRQVHSDGK